MAVINVGTIRVQATGLRTQGLNCDLFEGHVKLMKPKCRSQGTVHVAVGFNDLCVLLGGLLRPSPPRRADGPLRVYGCLPPFPALPLEFKFVPRTWDINLK